MGDKLVVTAEDLCRIIKSCAQNGVREFTFGVMRLEFGKIDQSIQSSLEPVETKPTEQVSNQISEDALQKDKLERLQDDLEDLKLTDPLQYEKLLGGDLGDVGAS